MSAISRWLFLSLCYTEKSQWGCKRGEKTPTPKSEGGGSLPMSVLESSARMWDIEDHFSLSSGNVLAQTPQGSVLPCRWHSSGLRDSPQLKPLFAHKKMWDLSKNNKKEFRFLMFMHLTLRLHSKLFKWAHCYLCYRGSWVEDAPLGSPLAFMVPVA